MARLLYELTFFNETVANGPGSLRLHALGNVLGTPEARIYLDGGAAPGYTVMVGSPPNYFTGSTLAPGIYRVEYRDDNGERLLGKVRIYSLAETCFGSYSIDDYQETGFTGSFRVTATGIYIKCVIDFQNPDLLVINRQIYASVDNGLTYKGLDSVNNRAFWNTAELAAVGADEIIPNVLFQRSANCSDTIQQGTQISVEQPALEPLAVSYEKTNVTSFGGSDGTITLTVTGGSGSYSFLWSDGAVTQNRVGLVAGLYSVTVTDTVTLEEVDINDIEITEPQFGPEPGDFLFVPLLNGLRFVTEDVVDNCNVFQNFDNTLFCKEKHPYHFPAHYYIKVAKCDVKPVQFQSNYPDHRVEVYNDTTDELVGEFTADQKIQLVGLISTFGVFITDHTTSGQSRVYFNDGAFPITIEIGDTVVIFNNADGFDGNYSIVDIQNDELLGSQYFVINKLYDIPAQNTSAQANFSTSVVNFNIFEVILNLQNLPDGNYYVRITGVNDGDVGNKSVRSEPIYLKADHPDTNCIDYRNVDNGFDMAWRTGITCRIRVESQFYKPVAGGQDENYRESNYSPVKLVGKASRKYLLETFDLPAWLHEKLNVVFRLDTFFVNGVKYFSEEGYAEAVMDPRYRKGNSSVTLEQVGWFKDYNGDDLDTVESEGGIFDDSFDETFD